MTEALLADSAAGHMSMDYAFDRSVMTGACRERTARQNATLASARGTDRGDSQSSG